MTTERIKQIQSKTAYPESRSVHQALLKVWNECAQENKFSEKEVELIAHEMVNWALDNVGNQNAQSGKKFDEVLNKFKTNKI